MITFESLLEESLPWIDDFFAKEGKPVYARPFAAAQVVVEHFLVSVKDDTKDNYLMKPWFIGIFEPVWKWYEQRYGQTLLKSPQAQAVGLVHYLGSPLTFHVPLVLNEPGDDGTTWIRFPKEVLQAEDPLAWLDTSPPLNAISPKRRDTLRRSIVNVANLLRGIHNALNTADLEKSVARPLVSTVLKHFEKAALDGVSHDPQTIALGIWDLQMGCEKTMKAFLLQSGLNYPETHNLRELQRLVMSKSNLTEAKQFVSIMPSERRVIAWRYSELLAPTPAEFYRFYLAALSLSRLYAAKMMRKFVFDNAAIQIRKPPWK